MIEETIVRRGTTLVGRIVLNPGEATRWHRDPYHRVTVVVRGSRLAIEFRDGRPPLDIPVAPGLAEWDEPSEVTHRAVNTGNDFYEQVSVFFLENPDDVAQPDAS